jgi:hypothetical protein
MLAYTDRDTLDQFQLDIEQLEDCCELIKSKSLLKSRNAVILLDHFAEIKMYRKCSEHFSRDHWLRFIRAPKFSAVEQRQILHSFDKKVKCLQAYNTVSEVDSIVLSIAHTYRNAIYHRDSHNPKTINVLARILFRSVGNVYVGVGDNTSIGGVPAAEVAWLCKYGYSTGMVDIPQLRKKVVSHLNASIAIPFVQLKTTFIEDVLGRIAAIDKLIKQDLPLRNPSMLDEILRDKEFNEKHSDKMDDLSRSFREVRYRIVSGGPVTREEYMASEAAYKWAIKSALKNFSPKISRATIRAFQLFGKQLEKAQDLRHLLTAYQRQDILLHDTERYLDEAYNDYETAVQMQIDIARGK